MPTTVHAYAAQKPSAPFKRFEYDMPEIGPEEVDIRVKYCGVCHSDLSMWHDHWEMSEFPFIPGHEIVGEVVAVGDLAKGVSVGQMVGLGWFSSSCMQCQPCMSGHHNLCHQTEQTIVGRYGGFADRVRAHWSWCFNLPDNLDLKKLGPLFCGGITVFNPIKMCDVKPTDRVGVIGIGGLGHLALQFLNHWGCEVTAFTHSPEKTAEAKRMGADRVLSSTDEAVLEGITNQYDFILSTVNVPLNWDLYLQALKPQGRFHTVGAVPEPLEIPAFSLIKGEKSVSGSPLGSPATNREMLEFCARHNIVPVTEHFKMSEINEAFAHLESGKARYRIVLEADF